MLNHALAGLTLAVSQTAGFTQTQNPDLVQMGDQSKTLVGFRLSVQDTPQDYSTDFQTSFQLGAHRKTDLGYDFYPMMSFGDGSNRNVFNSAEEEGEGNPATVWLIGGGLVLLGVAALASGEDSDNYKCEATGFFEGLCP